MELIPSKFEKIKFTEEELLVAKAFSGLNLLYLKSVRAEFVENKLALRVENPDNIKSFLQEEAELHGVISILTELIGDGE